MKEIFTQVKHYCLFIFESKFYILNSSIKLHFVAFLLFDWTNLASLYLKKCQIPEDNFCILIYCKSIRSWSSVMLELCVGCTNIVPGRLMLNLFLDYLFLKACCLFVNNNWCNAPIPYASLIGNTCEKEKCYTITLDFIVVYFQ